MRSGRPYLGLLFLLPLLAGCLGEPALPTLEPYPAPTRSLPPVELTIVATPHLTMNLISRTPVANQPAPQIPHDLIGRSDCLMCHKQGVGEAPRIPDAHQGLDSTTCQTCHAAPASAELSGAEMYTRVCARCHGAEGEGGVGPALNARDFLNQVSETELRETIIRGRGASEMLAWGDLGLLTERQVDDLVAMIRGWESTAPETAMPPAPPPASALLGDPEVGETLFAQLCSGCHGLGGEVPVAGELVLREAVAGLQDAEIAQRVRDGGGGMPPFHGLLSSDDINDLLALMRSWRAGPQLEPTAVELSGEEVFARVCARCHGKKGEGGIGPPLNSKEFLQANDDETIRQWIQRGTLGTSMLSWGDLGLLSDAQIDELVAYIRAWEPEAPVTGGGPTAKRPPSAADGDPAHGQQLFAQFCSGCHGLDGNRRVGGVVIHSEAFLQQYNDEILASQIQNGGRQMPSFHAILTSQDVNDLLAFIRAGFTAEQPTVEAPSFSQEVQPILAAQCALCHGAAGGWEASDYRTVMTSGDHAPVIVPGDLEGSLLAQKVLGTQTIGGPMPPTGLLDEGDRQIILDWIAAGAPDN